MEDAGTPYPATLPRPRDLTPAPHRAIDPDQVALSPDGSTVIAAVKVGEPRDGRFILVAIDVESGVQTTLFDEADVDFQAPAISHDGAARVRARTAEHPRGPGRPGAVDGRNRRRRRPAHRLQVGPLADAYTFAAATTLSS